MKQDTNQPSLSQIEVVHALPGRVRLRVLGENTEERLKELSRYLREQEGINSVLVKPTTSSLVVIFDPQARLNSQLQECLSPSEPPANSLASETRAASSSAEKIFTQLLSLVPVVLGWLVVKRLNLSGWKAIATYLLATGITGEIIEQVQLQLLPALKETNLTAKKAQPERTNPVSQEQELDFQILHHLRGRIRLLIPKIRQDRNYARQFKLLLEQDPRITAVRINDDAGSAIVNYLPEAVAGLSEQELTAMLSNWMELIDSVIALETATNLSAQTENAVARDGNGQLIVANLKEDS